MIKDPLPSIEEFLTLIDPENKLNKKEILSEIILITVIESLKNASDQLDPADREEAKKLIRPGSGFQPYKAVDLFKKSGKIEKLQEIIRTTAVNIEEDYIRTQFNSLNPEIQKTVTVNFPGLKEMLQ